MKAWLSPSELVAAGLPGLPGTVQRINARATREGWVARQRKAIGGGREYHVDSLPEAARKALAAPADVTPKEVAVAGNDTRFLSKSERDTVEARLVLLSHIDRQVLVGGLTVGQAIDELVAGVRDGTADPQLIRFAKVANARRPTLSRRTVFRWRERAQAGQVALAPKPMPKAEIPAWAEPLMRLWARPTQPSKRQCVETLQAELGEAAPSYDQALRFLNQLDAISKSKGRMGPRELKSLRWYRKRSVDGLRPAAIYSSDGHTADFEVAHPKHGRPFRPEITSIVDIFTRRVVGWSAGLAEATWGTLDAMRHAFTTAGVCDIWYVDNGRGFNNAHFDDEVTGYLGRLGVTKTNSLPYSSQARGVIERLHQSLWIREGRNLVTYVGRDMDREAAQKVHKRTRRDVAATGASALMMPWPEFLAWAQEAVDRYNARPHSALPKTRDPVTGRTRHMSPAEAWSKAVEQGFEADVIDAGNLDLFRPYERRKVARALVSLFGNEYFARELEPLHGQDVLVGYDIHDANSVVVRTVDQRFLCTATWNGHATSYMPVSMLEHAAATRAKGRLGRLDRQRDEVIAERDGRLIEHQPGQSIDLAMPAERIEAAERAIERIETAKAAPVAPAMIGDRPNWAQGPDGDMAYITWLLANPDKVQESDRKVVRDVMKRPATVFYMRTVGFDIDAATRFARGETGHESTLGNIEESQSHATAVL